jgi:hypothetical protein
MKLSAALAVAGVASVSAQVEDTLDSHTLYWRHNQNFDTVSNWNVNRDEKCTPDVDENMPEGCPENRGGTTIFNGEVILGSCSDWTNPSGEAYKITGDTELGGLTLPSDGQVFLASGITITFSEDKGNDDAEWRCKTQKEQNFKCGENWALGDSNGPSAHMVPCTEDVAVFPDDSAPVKVTSDLSFVREFRIEKGKGQSKLLTAMDTSTGKMIDEQIKTYYELYNNQFQGVPISTKNCGSDDCRRYCLNVPECVDDLGKQFLDEDGEVPNPNYDKELYEREATAIADAQVNRAEELVKYVADLGFDVEEMEPTGDGNLVAFDSIDGQMSVQDLGSATDFSARLGAFQSKFASLFTDSTGAPIAISDAQKTAMQEVFFKTMDRFQGELNKDPSVSQIQNVQLEITPEGGVRLKDIDLLKITESKAQDVVSRLFNFLDAIFDEGADGCESAFDDGKVCSALYKVDKDASTVTMGDNPKGKDFSPATIEGALQPPQVYFSYADANFEKSIFNMGAISAVVAETPSTMAECAKMIEGYNELAPLNQTLFEGTVETYASKVTALDVTTFTWSGSDGNAACQPMNEIENRGLGARRRRASVNDLAYFSADVKVSNYVKASDPTRELMSKALAEGAYLAELVFLTAIEAQQAADAYTTTTTTTVTETTSAPGLTDAEMTAEGAKIKELLEGQYGAVEATCKDAEKAEVTALTGFKSALSTAEEELEAAIEEKDAVCLIAFQRITDKVIAQYYEDCEPQKDTQKCKPFDYFRTDEKAACTTEELLVEEKYTAVHEATADVQKSEMKIDYFNGKGTAIEQQGNAYAGVCAAARAAEASGASSDDDEGFPLLYVIIVAAVLLCIICILIVVVMKKGGAKEAAGGGMGQQNVVAFENPMYDDPTQGGGGMGAPDDGGLYDEPAFNMGDGEKANPMYASNENVGKEGGGYLDVQPDGDDDDDDDDDSDEDDESDEDESDDDDDESDEDDE